MGLPELTADISNLAGAPKNIAAVFVLRLYEKYFDQMVHYKGIEGALAALIICCSEKTERERIWDYYTDLRKGGKSTLTAAVLSLGELYSYMANAMGLDELKVAAELQSDTTIAGFSPKNITAISFFRLFEKFFEFISATEGIDGMTATLLITEPIREKRNANWDKYMELKNEKNDDSDITPSVYITGDWYQDMCDRMDLNEISTGAW